MSAFPTPRARSSPTPRWIPASPPTPLGSLDLADRSVCHSAIASAQYISVCRFASARCISVSRFASAQYVLVRRFADCLIHPQIPAMSLYLPIRFCTTASLSTDSLLPTASLSTDSLLPTTSLSTDSLLHNTSLSADSLRPTASLSTDSLLPTTSLSADLCSTSKRTNESNKQTVNEPFFVTPLPIYVDLTRDPTDSLLHNTSLSADSLLHNTSFCTTHPKPYQ